MLKKTCEKSKLKKYASSKNHDLSRTLSSQIDESLKLANQLPSGLNDQLYSAITLEIVNNLRTALISAAQTTASLASKLQIHKKLLNLLKDQSSLSIGAYED